MSRSKLPRGRLADQIEYYARTPSRAEAAIEREVHGVNAGINSYTTVAQADALVQALSLGPGMVLLDVGGGTGWPGVHLVRTSGCSAVITDVPEQAIREAAGRAARRRVRSRCSFAVASGADLPFQSRSFDAVVHTDVL